MFKTSFPSRVFAFFLLVSTLSAHAFAGPEDAPARAHEQPYPELRDPPTVPSVEPPTESYGAPIYLADGAALVTMTVGISKSSTTVGGIGIAMYALGGPIVHLAHGEPLRAVGSLAMRAVLPPLLGLAGYGLGKVVGGSGSDWYVLLLGVGLLGGIVTTSILDATYLAKREVKTSSSWRVTPTVAIDAKSLHAGLFGSF
jgi:hypothetical protein